jgi:adenosylmethionine-8-amino-7-oxononanoate aminotransferase
MSTPMDHGEVMASAELPDTLEPNGEWRHAFSYHPMDVVLERADGIYLYDASGNRYIDATGGPFVMNLPHNHPRMKAAITRQLERYTYPHPVLANPERARYCAMLAEITPGTLNTTYLVSGGSEAVETAFKLARQAQIVRGNHDKYKIVSCRDSYHGMTLAALGASHNPNSQRHFMPMLPHWPHIRQYSDFDRPAGMSRDDWGVECARALEVAIHYEGPQSVAAFIATPHGCGPDYGVVPPRTYWQTIREICDRYEVLLIIDEVVTGFGRTGHWFAMEHFEVAADIMTLGKGISSGYVPFGAVCVSDEINQAFLDSEAYFVHGFTMGGHGLACAAGQEVIRIIRDEQLLENCRAQSERLFAYRERLLQHGTVADVRGWGLFLVAEMVRDKNTMEFFAPEQQAEKLFQALALRNGLALYGSLYGPRRQPAFRRGIPIWISPSLSIRPGELDDLMARFEQTLDQWEAALL